MSSPHIVPVSRGGGGGVGGLLDAVYDVTVAYPKTLPLSELDLIKGKMPEEVHFHIKR